MKTLLVDDDESMTLYFDKLLGKYGPCVLTGDGAIAISHFFKALDQNEPFDLVLLDIMMPELDGLTVLGKLRSLEKEYGLSDVKRSKIIMTTALKNPMHIQEAYDEQCDAYMIKPITKDTFMQELSDLGVGILCGKL